MFKHICIFSLFICLGLGCRSIDKNIIYKGEITEKFVGKNSGYHWNFKRVYTDSLSEVKRTDDYLPLTYIKSVNDSIVCGLNYKNATIYFLSTNNLDTLFSFKDSRNKEIMNFEYANNQLFLYNFTNRALKKYDVHTYNNSLLNINLNSQYIIPNNASIYRASYIDSNKLIYASPNSQKDDINFITLNRDSNKCDTNSFNKLLHISHRKPNVDLAYDGEFISNNESKFLVYDCSFAGYFIVFNKFSKEVYGSKTIDKTPAPDARFVKIAPNVAHLEIKPNVKFFQSASVYKNNLYILNFISKKEVPSIDIYNLKNNGSYANSICVPYLDEKYRPISISVQKNILFVLYNNQVLVKYEINGARK